jgi:hypothetical protein
MTENAESAENPPKSEEFAGTGTLAIAIPTLYVPIIFILFKKKNLKLKNTNFY